MERKLLGAFVLETFFSMTWFVALLVALVKDSPETMALIQGLFLVTTASLVALLGKHGIRELRHFLTGLRFEAGFTGSRKKEKENSKVGNPEMDSEAE